MAQSYVENSVRDQVIEKLLHHPENKVTFFTFSGVLIANLKTPNGHQALSESSFATNALQNIDNLDLTLLLLGR